MCSSISNIYKCTTGCLQYRINTSVVHVKHNEINKSKEELDYCTWKHVSCSIIRYNGHVHLPIRTVLTSRPLSDPRGGAKRVHFHSDGVRRSVLYSTTWSSMWGHRLSYKWQWAISILWQRTSPVRFRFFFIRLRQLVFFSSWSITVVWGIGWERRDGAWGFGWGQEETFPSSCECFWSMCPVSPCPLPLCPHICPWPWSCLCPCPSSIPRFHASTTTTTTRQDSVPSSIQHAQHVNSAKTGVLIHY